MDVKNGVEEYLTEGMERPALEEWIKGTGHYEGERVEDFSRVELEDAALSILEENESWGDFAKEHGLVKPEPYRVQFMRLETYVIEVEADSEAEAIERAKNESGPLGEPESVAYDYYEIAE